MRLSNAADLQRVLAADRPARPSEFALGTVTTPLGTLAQVTFDEDLTEAAAPLTTLDSYTAALGDRVLLGKVNRAWVVLGRINTGTPKWIPLAMNAGWSNIGGSYQSARFALIGGWVVFQGVITKATQIGVSDLIAPAGTVPAGYLPAARGLFTSAASGAGNQAMRLYVGTDGSLGITNATAPPAGANFGLDPIRYPAEQ